MSSSLDHRPTDSNPVPAARAEPEEPADDPLPATTTLDGKISGLTFFLDTARWFPLFGLPPRLDP